MAKPFLRFFLLSIITFLLFSFSSSRKEEEITILNYVISQNKNIEDSVILKHNFDKLKQSSNPYISKNLDVIFQVYLANIYSNKFDKLNPKSETLLLDALEKAKKLNLNDLQIWVNTQFGYYYYHFSKYKNAYPYFMEATKLLDTTDDQYIFEKSEIYKKNAYFFMNVKEYDKSKRYLFLALKHTNKEDFEYATILNAIGHIYYNQNNFEKAYEYFKLTKNFALKQNNKIRYAKALGDISLINIEEKKYDEAIENLKKDIQISKELDNLRNLMFANIRLGELYIKLEKISEAETILKEAQNYAETKDYLKSFEYDIYKLLLNISIKNNDTGNELIARRKISELEKQINLEDGENVINEINWNIEKDNFNYKYEAELAKTEKTKLLRNAFIIIAALLSLIIIFVYLSFKRKIKIQNSDYENLILSFQNEKLKSENKLNSANNTLNSYKTYLSEKNLQIKDLYDEIDKVQSSSSGLILEKRKLELNKLLNSHLMTEENWSNFKNIFYYEQKEFVDQLNTNFPDLTDSNLRIIYLQKLGLNNSEIAQLLGINVDSVKKSKQRLKKKYENFDELFNS